MPPKGPAQNVMLRCAGFSSVDDIHVINCENNRRGFSSVGSYGFELNSSNFAVQLHKRSANNANHIDWVTFFIIQCCF